MILRLILNPQIGIFLYVSIYILVRTRALNARGKMKQSSAEQSAWEQRAAYSIIWFERIFECMLEAEASSVSGPNPEKAENGFSWIRK